MLLLLAEYLQQFHTGFGVFQYLTLRGILGVLTALGMALFLGPWMIRTLQLRQIGQAVRNDGPQSHLSKKGTPTMGGALILTAITISTLLWADLSNRFIWIAVFSTCAYAAIGFTDDYTKVTRRRNLGLTSRAKFGLQIGAGFDARQLLGVAEDAPTHRGLRQFGRVAEGAGDRKKMIDSGHVAISGQKTAYVNGQITVRRLRQNRSNYRYD